MGLGAEVGYWYLKERELQHAADVAAQAAAVRLNRGDPKPTLDSVALNVATNSGFKKSDGTITVNWPPASGPGAGDRTQVEVILSRSLSRAFSSFFATGPVRVGGRAVAKVYGPKICSLALNTTASAALQVKASSSVTFENCVVGSNSKANNSYQTGGSSSLTGDCIYTVGGAQQSGSSSTTLKVCGTVKTSSPPIPDPYADVAIPTVSTPCVSGAIGSNNVITNVPPPTVPLPDGTKFRRYCSLSTNGHVTFPAGLYIVENDFTSNGQSITGNGATFLVKGTVTLAGSVVLNLTAPTSGAYSGLVFFGDRDADLESVKITGASGSIIQGAVYFPTGKLEYTGSSAAGNGCTQIIANQITFTGNSGVKSSCEGTGTRNFALAGRARIVE
jgi:hypothetical protein